MAQSTTKAEFIVAIAAVNQAFWVRKILADMQIIQTDSTKVFVDNQVAIEMSNNFVFFMVRQSTLIFP